MDNKYWNQKWESGDIAFDQKSPNSHLVNFFEKVNIPKGGKILVPLCGRSIDMLWFAQQGYNVIGCELNLNACRDFFAYNKLEYVESIQDEFTVLRGESVTLYAGDIFSFKDLYFDKTDLIYDRGALVALPLHLRRKYVEHLKKISHCSTDILIITAKYNQAEMAGPPFSVDDKEIDEHFAQGYVVNKLLDKEAPALPDHLVAKGLTRAWELVYYCKAR